MNILVLRKRFVTLIEMMIVMFLIALIIGVVGYNYRGTLEGGKAFKTKTGMEKLQTILDLAVAEDPRKLDDLESNWQNIIKASPLVSDSNALIRDGWGETYQVTVENGKIEVRSRKYEEHLHSEGAK